MTTAEVREMQHEGWLRTGLQIASIIFLAGMGWAQLSNMSQRIDALERARLADAQASINRIERLTAIETKLDFILAQAPKLADMVPAPKQRGR
jgi:hypothetical protein